MPGNFGKNLRNMLYGLYFCDKFCNPCFGKGLNDSKTEHCMSSVPFALIETKKTTGGSTVKNKQIEQSIN